MSDAIAKARAAEKKDAHAREHVPTGPVRVASVITLSQLQKRLELAESRIAQLSQALAAVEKKVGP